MAIRWIRRGGWFFYVVKELQMLNKKSFVVCVLSTLGVFAGTFAGGAYAQSPFPGVVEGRAVAGVAVLRGPSGIGVSFRDTYTGDVLDITRVSGSAFLGGVKGQRYSVVLENTSGRRVLAVVSVDGVNVVSGETAAVGQTGYVLEPYQSATVEGWRKSNAEVAAFAFSSVEGSYASKTGRADNVGVIGIAWFNEKRPEPVREVAPVSRSFGGAQNEGAAADSGSMRMKAQGMPSAPAAAPTLGTGHGERIESQVSHTTFDREYAPFHVQSIRYGLKDVRARGGREFHQYVPDAPTDRRYR